MVHNQTIHPSKPRHNSRNQRLPILCRRKLLPHRPANILAATLLHQRIGLPLRSPIAEDHPAPLPGETSSP